MSADKLAIFQNDQGGIELAIDANAETIWATQAQMAQLFEVTTQNITIHLGSIYSDGELQPAATCKESLQVHKEGSRDVKRKVKIYNLDAIISVGYRVNSKTATQLRQWATKTLKQYITDGFAIDRQRIEHSQTQFMAALDDMKLLARDNPQIGGQEVVDLVEQFAQTWLSLDAYDKSELPDRGQNKKAINLKSNQLEGAIENLKTTLIEKNEATELFAQPREADGLQSIIGNLLQSFDGQELYPSLEEKAANLLYLVVKNHVFVDGNKRSGAFAFVWFLREAGMLNTREISPQALTALTLMIAESDPHDKPKTIGLILLMLRTEDNDMEEEK